jgi:hypothetical protein
LYASTEPCTFCRAAMYYAGITRVVYGVSSKALQELTGWHDEGLPCDELYRHKGEKLDSIGPILEEEGLEVFHHMPKKTKDLSGNKRCNGLRPDLCQIWLGRLSEALRRSESNAHGFRDLRRG